MQRQELETARGALDCLIDPLVGVDRGGLIIYANKPFAHLVGVRRREKLPGQRLSEFLIFTVEGEPEPVASCLERGRPTTWREVRAVLAADQAEMSIILSAIPLLDGEATIGVLLDLSDKTEEQRVHTKYREIMAAREKSFRETVKILSGLIELRNKELGAHGRAVARSARRAAKELGLDEEDQHEIELAAMLHDIGKIGLPDELAKRPLESMNEQEQQQYKMHPVLGQVCLQGVEELEPMGILVRHHHERWDGKGFPDGIEAEAIPIGARIIAVANAYQKALSSEEGGDLSNRQQAARRILEKGANTHYDPRVVEVFVESHTAHIRRMENQTVPRAVKVENLRNGMILDEDLTTPQGLLLVPSGEQISAAVLKRISGFLGIGQISKNIRVLVDRDEAAQLDAAESRPTGFGSSTMAGFSSTTVPSTVPSGPAPAVSAPSTSAGIPGDKENRGSGERVLVIDDNNATRRLLTTALEEAGYEMKSAATAGRGVELLKDGGVKLIILDLALPDMDGLQLLRKLKTLGGLKDIPVLICTARKDRATLVDAICAGAADVLVKPFSTTTLAQKVWRCIEEPKKTMADRLKEEASKKQTITMRKPAPK